MKTEHKKYSLLINKISNTYTGKQNLYNLVMYIIKNIKKGNNENLRSGLKDIFNNFANNVEDLILIFEYLKAKKCKSLYVYSEILFYFKNFKDGRINSNLEFINKIA